MKDEFIDLWRFYQAARRNSRFTTRTSPAMPSSCMTRRRVRTERMTSERPIASRGAWWGLGPTHRIDRTLQRSVIRLQPTISRPATNDCKSPLNRLRHHVDRPARTFRRAQPAALAIIEVELEALARPELDHRVVGADAVAIVAFEAIAAGEAAARFVERVGLVEAALDLVEILDAPRRRPASAAPSPARPRSTRR